MKKHTICGELADNSLQQLRCNIMLSKVKFIKLLLIGMLLFIVSIIPGELFQGYLDQYNDFYKTSFYLPENGSTEVMLNDLTETAKKHNIHIFKIYEREKNKYSVNLDVYTDENMAKVLANDYKISHGIYKSIFSGTAIINVHNFSDIPQKLIETDEYYYLYGDSKDMIRFKKDLINVYAGSFPKDDGYNDLEYYTFKLITSWIFVLAILVLLSIYDVISQKKENFIRITMGEKAGVIYLKNVVLDSVYILSVFLCSQLLIKKIEGNLIFSEYSNVMLLITILINCFVLLMIFKFDVKDAFSNSPKNNILKYNYLLLGLCSIFFTLSVVSCVELINNSYSYSKQELFFAKNKNYSWYQNITIENGSEEELQMHLNDFISENMDSFHYLCSGIVYDEINNDVLYEANSGTKSYLKSKIKELNDKLDHDTYLLIYEKNKLKKEELETIKNYIDNKNYQIIYYSDPIEIIYRQFDEAPLTSIAQNPVIVFHNKEDTNLSYNESMYEFHLCMIDNHNNVWHNFAERNGISFIETNVYDYYCYRWDALSRTLLINLVIVLFLAIMLFLSSCVVIKLEFRINAKEIALKKIHGYRMIECFKKIYTIPCISTLLSIICVIIIKNSGVGINPLLITIILLLFLILQYLYITCQVIINDRKT